MELKKQDVKVIWTEKGQVLSSDLEWHRDS